MVGREDICVDSVDGKKNIFGFDFVGFLFGGQLSMLSRIIFALVGLAGLWSITLLFKDKVPQDER